MIEIGALYFFLPTHNKPVVQLFLFMLVIWENLDALRISIIFQYQQLVIDEVGV